MSFLLDRSPTVSEVLPVTTDVSEMSAELATFFVRPEETTDVFTDS
jgi:hypothetical protein